MLVCARRLPANVDGVLGEIIFYRLSYAQMPLVQGEPSLDRMQAQRAQDRLRPEQYPPNHLKPAGRGFKTRGFLVLALRPPNFPGWTWLMVTAFSVCWLLPCMA